MLNDIMESVSVTWVRWDTFLHILVCCDLCLLCINLTFRLGLIVQKPDRLVGFLFMAMPEG